MRIQTYLIAAALILAVGACASREGRKSAAREEPRTNAVGGETREECLKAIKKARIDARNGSYRMYIFGSKRYDGKFARFLGEIMKTRHGIDLIITGPDDRERNKCYSNEMDKIILNTFGPDILASTEEEAREIFDSRR